MLNPMETKSSISNLLDLIFESSFFLTVLIFIIDFFMTERERLECLFSTACVYLYLDQRLNQYDDHRIQVEEHLRYLSVLMDHYSNKDVDLNWNVEEESIVVLSPFLLIKTSRARCGNEFFFSKQISLNHRFNTECPDCVHRSSTKRRRYSHQIHQSLLNNHQGKWPHQHIF